MGIFEMMGNAIRKTVGKMALDVYRTYSRGRPANWKYVIEHPKRGEDGYSDLQRTVALILLAWQGSRDDVKKYFSAEKAIFKRNIQNLLWCDEWKRLLDRNLLCGVFGFDPNELL